MIYVIFANTEFIVFMNLYVTHIFLYEISAQHISKVEILPTLYLLKISFFMKCIAFDIPLANSYFFTSLVLNQLLLINNSTCTVVYPGGFQCRYTGLGTQTECQN